MTFDEWMMQGYLNGWVSPPVCETHDGVPMSAAEHAEFEEGDPCIHIVRLYTDATHKAEVEAEHAPSIWRATNQGWE